MRTNGRIRDEGKNRASSVDAEDKHQGNEVRQWIKEAQFLVRNETMHHDVGKRTPNRPMARSVEAKRNERKQDAAHRSVVYAYFTTQGG